MQASLLPMVLRFPESADVTTCGASHPLICRLWECRRRAPAPGAALCIRSGCYRLLAPYPGAVLCTFSGCRPVHRRQVPSCAPSRGAFLSAHGAPSFAPARGAVVCTPARGAVLTITICAAALIITLGVDETSGNDPSASSLVLALLQGVTHRL